MYVELPIPLLWNSPCLPICHSSLVWHCEWWVKLSDVSFQHPLFELTHLTITLPQLVHDTVSLSLSQTSLGWVIPWKETVCWSCMNSISALRQLYSQYCWSWLELLAFLQSVASATHQHSYILDWDLVLSVLHHLDLHALQSISLDYTLIYDDCCAASQLTLPKPVKQLVFVEQRNMATIRHTAFSLPS